MVFFSLRIASILSILTVLALSAACTWVQPNPSPWMIHAYPNVQQSLDYSCGPAAAVAFARFYRIHADESAAIKKMGTDPKTGTSPEAIASWLRSKGLKVGWGEHGTLDRLKENLRKGKPTLVEWVDWGGHWVAVIGFDDQGTVETDDDEIILADSYDRVDGNPDGLTHFNVERFDTMWFDALNFGRLMKKIYLHEVSGGEKVSH